MNPSQSISLSNTLLTVLPLLLGIAAFTFILVSKYGNKNWPGIPSLTVRSLLWLARWLTLLASGYDQFLVQWRMKRRDNPICPENEAETPVYFTRKDDLLLSSCEEGSYLAKWFCSLCKSEGEVKAVRSPRISDSEFLDNVLEGARVAHVRTQTTEATKCYAMHGSVGVDVKGVCLDIGQIVRD